jgi:LysR family transcriptional regulator, transcription activator of glutamate synthase operon
MDLRQLRSLVAIAEEGQFTRAADRLGIAQSSLSAQIRNLEEELGLSVFDRTTRRVNLTDAGASLLETARSVLAEIDDVKSGLQQRRDLLSGQVTIGVTQTPGPVDVVGLLADFHHQHPSIELSVREDLSINLADQLRDDQLDIAILTIVRPEHRHGLELVPLAAERLVVVMPPRHPLSARKRLTIDELRAESFVVSPPGATIRTAVVQAAHEAGFDPRIAFESREVSRIRAIVAAGLGIAFLPRSDAHSPGPEVVSVELVGEHFNHTLSLCWRDRRRHSPAARALLADARSRPRSST